MLSLMLSLYGFSTYPRASETEDVVASAASAINDLAVPERMTYASISGPDTGKGGRSGGTELADAALRVRGSERRAAEALQKGA